MRQGLFKLRVRCALVSSLSGILPAVALGDGFVPDMSMQPGATLVASRLGNSSTNTGWGSKSTEPGAAAYLLNSQWSLVTQPLLNGGQSDLLPGSNPYGTGQDVQNVLVLPAKVPESGWIAGGGTAFLGDNTLVSTAPLTRWGGGPSGIVMMQNQSWSWGVEANHIWSYTIPALHGNASTSAFQPFMAFTQSSGLTWSVGSETTYDWVDKVWTVPVSAGLSKMFSFGSQKAMLGVEGKYWIARPDSVPGWGVRLTASVLFPD